MGFVYLVIFLFVVVIVFENYEVLSQPLSLRFNFIFAKYETTKLPYGVWLIIIFFLGYAIAYSKSVAYRIKYFAKSSELEKLKKQMKQEEKEKGKETITIKESQEAVPEEQINK